MSRRSPAGSTKESKVPPASPDSATIAAVRASPALSDKSYTGFEVWMKGSSVGLPSSAVSFKVIAIVSCLLGRRLTTHWAESELQL